MQARKLESTVDERIVRLESHVEHIQADVTEIKTDIRRLDRKVEETRDRLEQKNDSLASSLSDFRLSTERSFSKLKLWGLTLYITLATTLLGVMAKGFGWIK